MIALGALAASAHPVVRFPGDGVQLGVETGFSDAVAPLGLDVTAARALGPRVWQLSAGLTVPLLAFDLRDHRVDVAAEVPLRDRPWDARASAGLRSVATRNDAFDATSLGTVLGLAPGWYGERATLAAEASLWTAWATHLRTSDHAVEVGGARRYRGWAPLTAATARVGVRAGVLRGPIEPSLHAGWESRGKLNLVVPPAYVGLGLGLRP